MPFYRHTPGLLSPEVIDRVNEHLKNGAKIQAIKEVRVATTMGIREAKDYIDTVEGGGTPIGIPRDGLIRWHLAPEELSHLEASSQLRERLRGSNDTVLPAEPPKRRALKKIDVEVLPSPEDLPLWYIAEVMQYCKVQGFMISSIL